LLASKTPNFRGCENIALRLFTPKKSVIRSKSVKPNPQGNSNRLTLNPTQIRRKPHDLHRV